MRPGTGGRRSYQRQQPASGRTVLNVTPPIWLKQPMKSPRMVRGKDYIGVTSGASTDESTIDEVVARLNELT